MESPLLTCKVWREYIQIQFSGENIYKFSLQEMYLKSQLKLQSAVKLLQVLILEIRKDSSSNSSKVTKMISRGTPNQSCSDKFVFSYRQSHFCRDTRGKTHIVRICDNSFVESSTQALGYSNTPRVLNNQFIRTTNCGSLFTFMYGSCSLTKVTVASRNVLLQNSRWKVQF